MVQNYIFTSESVAEGHPDKICDQISDALLDLYLTYDAHARIAIEALVTINQVILAGEVKTVAEITPEKRAETVRQLLRSLRCEEDCFHWEKVNIHDYIHFQSPDVTQGIEQHLGILGAGDQGMMVGYATDETPALMPAPIYYAHRLMQAIQNDCRQGHLPGLKSDAKTQLSVIYRNNKPVSVDSMVISIQHEARLEAQDIKNLLIPYIYKILPDGWYPGDQKVYVNPTGRFVIGGPLSDTGLTGRKIMVDTYGSMASHGGGAFSGKDATKVDRSGAYMARYLAKNVVASGLSKKCTIQLAYAIGMAHPLAVYIDLHNTGTVSEEALQDYFMRYIDLTPKGIIQKFDLTKPKFLMTATYGHFGRDATPEGAFLWEKTDLVDSLQSEFQLPPLRVM